MWRVFRLKNIYNKHQIACWKTCTDRWDLRESTHPATPPSQHPSLFGRPHAPHRTTRFFNARRNKKSGQINATQSRPAKGEASGRRPKFDRSADGGSRKERGRGAEGAVRKSRKGVRCAIPGGSKNNCRQSSLSPLVGFLWCSRRRNRWVGLSVRDKGAAENTCYPESVWR